MHMCIEVGEGGEKVGRRLKEMEDWKKMGGGGGEGRMEGWGTLKLKHEKRRRKERLCSRLYLQIGYNRASGCSYMTFIGVGTWGGGGGGHWGHVHSQVS